VRTITVSVLLLLIAPQQSQAWDGTAHAVTARIAWDNLPAATRQKVVAALAAAPQDACLRDLFPNRPRPLAVRQREFFMLASMWADIVRPADDKDTRPCTRFHHREWHFVDYFWMGVSGGTADADRPRDRPDMPPAAVNAVERLGALRLVVACTAAPCNITASERATNLAWVLHLVGDLHQPLHTTSRITTEPAERTGDQGGNLFKLDRSATPLSLHKYWDEILDRGIARRQNEGRIAYANRVAALIAARHPRPEMAGRLRPGQFDAWAREGLETTKKAVYPETLVRNHMPDDAYRERALAISEEAIALAGYRLADLLISVFGA
jgi:hypothetical protein